MRRVRRRGGNKEKVFGCDLLEHLTTSSQEIPVVLKCCSEFVEHHGIVDGIYRLSGVSSNIQKLRGEFECDSSPDLNKDVYLQDIHCVSSLCKAYFRELPNPLLTYQLYDKFAEAVAIQLEEERLVKIRDVLKELPKPHYRTLEFLMRHLVKMASYSSETNMHARNLAIVWAPNLLRSKDIEASGFNGTAAFMEVRVQSIVVEFILTHVPQLFPDQGVSAERRNSLPSPSAMSPPGEVFFKCAAPPTNFGNISPGDGPLAMRSYHAIIEGTDKRKGSLKGKKWMSIFNIGGRFPDPRKKNKHSTKEKERPSLRPARSMDSLSTPSYPNEGTRSSGPRPPSTSTSPLVTASPKPGSEAPGSGVSQYAVTYRRGTGLVSGGAGTQGTYTALDPDGLGIAGSESVQTRSPGLTSKAGRRAAMHITGPTMVTVPLHITSNLALGVLQGGGADRIVHRGRENDGGERTEGKEGGEKVDGKESDTTERKVEEEIKVVEIKKPPRRKDRGGVVAVEGNTLLTGLGEGGGEEKDEGAKEERKEEEQEPTDGNKEKPELVGRSKSREEWAQSVNSSTHEDPDDNSEYMEMKGSEATAELYEDCEFEASDKLNSTEAEDDDPELSGYVQDNFDFLDQMDCSALDHMQECSMSYQMNEFSVEPPGHSDDEYELMSQSQHFAELPANLNLSPETYVHNPNELNPHRPLSLDLQNRHTKSLSLPYMTSPIHNPEESGSEDEDPGNNSDDEDYSSVEDEDMFYKSLPPDFFLNATGFEQDTETQAGCAADKPHTDLMEEDREAESLQQDDAQQQEEVKDGDGHEEEQITEKEEEHAVNQEDEQIEESQLAEEDLGTVEDAQTEKAPASDVSAQFDDFPPPSDEDIQEENKGPDAADSDSSPHQTECCGQKETEDALVEEFGNLSAQDRDSDNGDDRKESEETEAVSQDVDPEIIENHENTSEEPTKEDEEVITDKKHEEEMKEGDKEQQHTTCRSSSEIWDELEDVVCEVIENEESEQSAKEAVSEQLNAEENVLEEEEDEENKADVRMEATEATDEKLPDPEIQQEPGDLEEGNPEEVASKEPEKENNDEEKSEEQQSPLVSVTVLKEAETEIQKSQVGRKCVEGDISIGGVGRKLVVSKSPKVYQAKAVPVVPPKPQHCKITALTLRQQQQQQQLRERRDAEQDKANAGDAGERERRRDGDEGAANRNSPLSMCFDEAVAIATMRREKEKVCEKEKERPWEWSSEVQ